MEIECLGWCAEVFVGSKIYESREIVDEGLKKSGSTATMSFTRVYHKVSFPILLLKKYLRYSKYVKRML